MRFFLFLLNVFSTGENWSLALMVLSWEFFLARMFVIETPASVFFLLTRGVNLLESHIQFTKKGQLIQVNLATQTSKQVSQ